VNWFGVRFSNDFTSGGSASGTIQSALPASATWQEYLAEAENAALAVLLALPTQTALATLGARKLTYDSGLIPVPVSINVSKEQVFPEDLNPVWGDLFAGCYSQIQLWDGNGYAYGRDLVGISKAAKATIGIFRSLVGSKDPATFTKSVADLFLSFRYGWCLTVKDTLALNRIDVDRAYPNGNCKRSQSYTYQRNGVYVIARAAVYCNPVSNSTSALDGFLKAVDFDLTLENLWDLVPLSFVVDWFTGLGDFFDRIDLCTQVDSFNVMLCGKSIKTTRYLGPDLAPDLSNMVGSAVCSYYIRKYQSDPVYPSLISYRNSNQKFDHWLEGGALVVQRL